MSLPRYLEYRDSGVEWLGELPAHWSVRRYKEVFAERDERSANGAEQLLSVSAYTGITPRAEGLAEGEFLSRAESLEGYRICYPNDLVINIMLAWNRGLGVTQHHGIVSPAYSVFRPVAGDAPRFLDYMVRSDRVILYFKAFSAGVIDSRLRLYPDTFGSLYCALPPVGEQVLIADFLDRETAKIDALIAEQETLLALLAEKRQATISHAVTRGLDSTVPMMDSGIAWLGEVPAHWKVVPFRYCVAFQEGPGIMAVDFLDEGVPLLRVSGVQGAWATLAGCNYLDPKRVEERWQQFRVEEGDLLISASASMGTVCEVGPEVVGSVPYTGIIRLKGVPGAMTKAYVRHLVVSGQFLTQIDLLKAGATIQHFGPTHLSQMFVAKPPVEEQAEIAAYLDVSLSHFARLENKARTAISLLQERRSALIAAAVTGKIDVRGLVEVQAA